MSKNSIVSYFKSSLEELSKVTWPTKNQAVKITILVLVFTVVSAAVLTLVDFGFDYLLRLLLSL